MHQHQPPPLAACIATPCGTRPPPHPPASPPPPPHTGNLLDDTELIDVLAVTKQTAQDVADRLANASETNAKINEACEEYRPVARRATLVYFLIAEFSVVRAGLGGGTGDWDWILD